MNMLLQCTIIHLHVHMQYTCTIQYYSSSYIVCTSHLKHQSIVVKLNMLLVGCKHRVSEGEFYIGGPNFVCQFIEPVMFVRCAFIFALRNIALGGYLDTRRHI